MAAMTAADLAAVYHVSLRTIRRWAATDHWHRTTTRPARYSLTDADRSWRKRHPSAVEMLRRKLAKADVAPELDT